MNISYHKFLELEVTHTYFPGGITGDFKLVPFSDTPGKLQNYNIRVRQQNNLFSFYCGTSDPENFDLSAELAGLATLNFQLLNDDYLFKNYTSETNLGSLDILYLNNRAHSDDLQMELAPANEEQKPNSIGVLLLDMQSIIDKNNPSKKLKLVFNAREVHWEYQILFGDNLKINEEDLKIVGIENESYVGPVKRLMHGNLNSLVMVSSIPLPLKKNIDRNPLLKFNYMDMDTNVTGDGELKLPNQDPQSIRIELKDGVTRYLSTSYIYV